MRAIKWHQFDDDGILGYDRYAIAGMNTEDNTRVINTHHYTTGTINPDTGTYSGHTTSIPTLSGTHDADVVVIMFRSGDSGAGNAMDARSVLGDDWRDIVETGPPRTCLS